MVTAPENAWAAALISEYYDLKDWKRGANPADYTPAAQACFRAIREGSQGLLGNPPVL